MVKMIKVSGYIWGKDDNGKRAKLPVDGMVNEEIEKAVRKTFHKSHIKKVLREMLEIESCCKDIGKMYELWPGITIDQAAERVRYRGICGKVKHYKTCTTMSAVAEVWHPSRNGFYGYYPEGWYVIDDALDICLDNGKFMTGMPLRRDFDDPERDIQKILDSWLRRVLDHEYIIRNRTAIDIII